MIFLCAADVSPLCDRTLYRAAYENATDERRKKTDRYQFEKDKYLSLGAEALLRHMLLKIGIKNYSVSATANGKPYIDNENVFFNLSHSGSYALCALSDSEIGCDIERIKPDMFKLSDRFFSPSERKTISEQPTPERKTDIFFRYWTLKESFIKATGLGFALPLDSFEIILDKQISVKQDHNNNEYFFKEFCDISGYKCAVCSRRNCEKVTLKTVALKEILQW